MRLPTKIMAENGKDIEAEKSKVTALKTENETLKNDKKSLLIKSANQLSSRQ